MMFRNVDRNTLPPTELKLAHAAAAHCDKLVDGVSPRYTHIMQHSRIAIVGAPLDLGQGRRGVDTGPSAIRAANLNKRLAALG
jgi:arginase family enzyme